MTFQGVFGMNKINGML